MLKIAELAPTPSASATIAANAKPGFALSARHPYLRSLRNSPMSDHLPRDERRLYARGSSTAGGSHRSDGGGPTWIRTRDQLIMSQLLSPPELWARGLEAVGLY